ncbi:MAG: hypothetical protein MUE99_04915, partial [Chitinophagaceae bacterium]|nr:hypothetical protein [Chitinophagaceae bacterium]
GGQARTLAMVSVGFAGTIFLLGLEGRTLYVNRLDEKTLRFSQVFETTLHSDPETHFPSIAAACFSDRSFWFCYLNVDGQTVLMHFDAEGRRLHTFGDDVFDLKPAKSKGKDAGGCSS